MATRKGERIVATASSDKGTQIVILSTFEGTETAQKALEALQRLDREGWVKTMDAAVLVRGQDGQVSFHDTEDVDAPHGALAGAITGALVGLLGGPAVAAAGAVAGAAGGGV